MTEANATAPKKLFPKIRIPQKKILRGKLFQTLPQKKMGKVIYFLVTRPGHDHELKQPSDGS